MKRLLVALALLGLAAYAACTRPALALDPGGPPVGKERAALLAGVRESYPHMPELVAGLYTDAWRTIESDARCEVVDWFAIPGSGAPDKSVALARRMVDYCSLGIADLNAGAARKQLKGKSFRFDVVGDVITLLARSDDPEVHVCCSLQFEMTRLGGSDYWAARRRLGDADAAILSLFVAKAERTPEAGIQRYRGTGAPSAPVQVAEGKLAGQLIDREIKSEALGETRRLNIYLPPGWSKDRTWPAVFLADNSAARYASLVEAMILSGRIAPIVLISAESGAPAVVGVVPTIYGADLRSAEYIRHFEGAGSRFTRHMAFFTQELVSYAQVEFSVSPRREDHVVAGFSSGGVFALWAGLMHPEVYAYAIPMSPGMAVMTADDLTTGVRARFRFAGGLYEPPFIATSQAAEAMLDAGGYDASGIYLSAGHDPDQWLVVLQSALLEIFPPR
jgi:enterochelin esterase-like enzyme